MKLEDLRKLTQNVTSYGYEPKLTPEDYAFYRAAKKSMDALLDAVEAMKEWKEFDWDEWSEEKYKKFNLDKVTKESDRLQKNIINALKKLEEL